MQARENLELSFTAEAEMVFTTLSSTGRRIFSRLPAPFETVLVDEAAQASEIAALQALTFGCRRCITPGFGLCITNSTRHVYFEVAVESIQGAAGGRPAS